MKNFLDAILRPVSRFLSASVQVNQHVVTKCFQHLLNGVFEFLRHHELVKSLLRFESVPSTVQRPDLVHLGGVVGG